MSILKEWLKAIGVLIVCFMIGLAGGLLYGLIIDHVEYTDVDPEDLALSYKEDYLILIAADYTQMPDLPLAQQRLRKLGFAEESVGKRAEQALLAKESAAGALARLATDLGFGNERITAALVTPSQTPTLIPTAIVSPSATASIRSSPTATASLSRTPRPSRTLRPSRTARPTTTIRATIKEEESKIPLATRTPSVTRTLKPPTLTATSSSTAEPPTLTPLPATATIPAATSTPTFDFIVSTVRMLSIEENGGCQGSNKAYVTVLDSEGNPLNAVIVALRWDSGEETQSTGNQANLAGQTQFDLYGGYQLLILNDANGNLVRSQLSRLITSQQPSVTDLIVAGYCSNQNNCQTQLCEGHYSWEIVFQKTN